MKKMIILGLLTIGLSGASLNNNAETVTKSNMIKINDTSKIEELHDKVCQLDSLMLEINKVKNEKNK